MRTNAGGGSLEDEHAMAAECVRFLEGFNAPPETAAAEVVACGEGAAMV